MIVENLQLARRQFERLEMHEAIQVIDAIQKRYEKLCDDVCAAASIDGNDRVADIIEEELDE